MLDIADALGWERFALLGHSMGGFAALLLAQAEPGLVGRVMSVDSLPFFSAMFGPQVTAEIGVAEEERAWGGLSLGDGLAGADSPEVARVSAVIGRGVVRMSWWRVSTPARDWSRVTSST